MIKRIKFWLLITCLTLRTPNWIRRTFGKICELDLSRPIDTPWGELEASCSTVIFRGMQGDDFVMAESTPGEVYVKTISNPCKSEWVEVYRHGKFVIAYDWIHKLKSINAYLSVGGIYRSRQSECLIESSQGIM